MANKEHKMIIIGSGPAGLTAAIYAARAELNPIVVAGKTPGGQLMMTTEVENFPGFEHGIMGPDLMQVMIKQAERFGATMVYEDAVGVDFGQEPFTVKTGSKEFSAPTVVIATGAATRWLGIESETRLRGHGVSSCATCDGAFFRNKKVFVVGGGDSAMEESNFITKFASSVTLLHRRDVLTASKIMQERARNNPKIDFLWNTEVAEVLGADKMTGLKLRNTQTGEISEVAGDGLFLAIGHVPNTNIFKDWLELDAKGYLVVKDGTKSKIPGVFIAGDVHDYRYRQAVTAAGLGCMAALDAEKYLASKE
ncbi:MAG: thioredoxin-disulfide reductase [Parcubacteria group bacterium]|nr:thioredoxin-disulfide reductase [Parcubacteria group bacterium]